jgi:hypothetical protein
LRQENEQLMMIKYLLGHQKATGQDIMNELGRIVTQTKKSTESSERASTSTDEK